jgi:hypothetical protein
MCSYSMVVDKFTLDWQPIPGREVKVPSQAEIDEFYKLLEKAREYDRKTNQPDCESESKKEALRILAEKLGVKIECV